MAKHPNPYESSDEDSEASESADDSDDELSSDSASV